MQTRSICAAICALHPYPSSQQNIQAKINRAISLAHLTGFLGPGMWTSDSLNLVGSIRFVKASFNLLAYARLAYGVISSHHIISGLLGTSIGLWHITLRPLAYLYNLLSMGKVESILSSSITAVFFTAFLISALIIAWKNPKYKYTSLVVV